MAAAEQGRIQELQDRQYAFSPEHRKYAELEKQITAAMTTSSRYQHTLDLLRERLHHAVERERAQAAAAAPIAPQGWTQAELDMLGGRRARGRYARRSAALNA